MAEIQMGKIKKVIDISHQLMYFNKPIYSELLEILEYKGDYQKNMHGHATLAPIITITLKKLRFPEFKNDIDCIIKLQEDYCELETLFNLYNYYDKPNHDLVMKQSICKLLFSQMTITSINLIKKNNNLITTIKKKNKEFILKIFILFF